MAHILPCYFHISNAPNLEFPNTCSHGRKIGGRKIAPGSSRGCVVQRCTVSSNPTSSVAKEPLLFESKTGSDVDGECLVNEFGWKVRKLARDEHEMREVSQIQAEAFHIPMAIFDDFFFQFFKAEVLAGLLYKLKNSPPDRYACLVAEPAVDSSESESKLVGVVDATAVRDEDVLQYLNGAEEYLYISGIAVSRSFRRQKIGSVLLKACDVLSISLGFEYLVLRAYEDDIGARRLYANAGYKVISTDPHWVTLIGRKRRVLMIKQPNLLA